MPAHQNPALSYFPIALGTMVVAGSYAYMALIKLPTEVVTIFLIFMPFLIAFIVFGVPIVSGRKPRSTYILFGSLLVVAALPTAFMGFFMNSTMGYT